MAGCPMGALIEDIEQLHNVLDIVLDELLKVLNRHVLAGQKVPNLGTTRGTAVSRPVAIRQ